MITESTMQVAHSYNEANQVLRRLLGDKFDVSNKPYQDALLQRMKDMKLSVMEASLYMLKESNEAVIDISDRQIAQAQILAATIEVLKKDSK